MMNNPETNFDDEGIVRNSKLDDFALRMWAIEQSAKCMSGCTEFNLNFLKKASEWIYEFAKNEELKKLDSSI